jgi:hypothetical protein
MQDNLILAGKQTALCMESAPNGRNANDTVRTYALVTACYITLLRYDRMRKRGHGYSLLGETFVLQENWHQALKVMNWNLIRGQYSTVASQGFLRSGEGKLIGGRLVYMQLRLSKVKVTRREMSDIVCKPQNHVTVA